MSGFDYFKICVTTKFADFTGRGRRSEFWYFYLFAIIITMPFSLLSSANPESTTYLILSGVVSLALFVPQLAAVARRLHDGGRSAWWYLIAFTIIGIPVLLYFLVQDSQPGRNKWGPNPKTGEDDQVLNQLV